MTDRNSRVIQGVRKFSGILQAYEAGLTTAEIKAITMETLVSEFRNTAMMNRYGIDLLTAEAINIQKIRTDPSALALYNWCMSVRRECLKNEQDECSLACSVWLEPISHALSLYWSSVRLEHSKTELSIQDFSHELFRNIGSLVEGTMQTYLKEILHLWQLRNKRRTSYVEIRQLSLGKVVETLSNAIETKSVLAPLPWGIPVNQWRNIAQHYSVLATSELILCRYGRANSNTIQLKRDDLMAVARTLFLIHSAVRTSHTIFFLDNADSLAAHCKPFERDTSDVLFQFSVGAASQGFEVTEITTNKEKAYAKLVDVTDSGGRDRALHASQFTYQLWIATSAEQVEVEYQSKTGDYVLHTTTQGHDCRKVLNGEEDLTYLAKVNVFSE